MIEMVTIRKKLPGKANIPVILELLAIIQMIQDHHQVNTRLRHHGITPRHTIRRRMLNIRSVHTHDFCMSVMQPLTFC